MSIFFSSINPSSFYFGDKTINKILFKDNIIWEKDNGGGEVDDLPYLRFTAEEAGSTVKMSKNGDAPAVYLETSTTGEDGSWTEFFVDETIITLPNIGDKVYFRAKQDNERFATSTTVCNYFVMTGKIAASGNLNTLLKADGSVLDLTRKQNCFCKMFQNCSSLTKAPELPATTLTYNCYGYMFSGCTSLTEAPELPAEYLATWCYYYMFQNCSSLTEAPELPATTLGDNCYSYMFSGCTSLTQAPTLPATTLVNGCYAFMFKDCTSLTQAPELPATTLVNGCYQSMFSGCTSLTEAPELPATTLTTYCYNFMFSGCSSLTKAPELPATILAINCYNGMFNRCTSLTEAPELIATTLASNCYQTMFQFSGISSFTVDMTACTSVPTLPSATLFSSSNKPYTVLVPASLYDEWIQATNWSTIASNIQAV